MRAGVTAATLTSQSHGRRRSHDLDTVRSHQTPHSAHMARRRSQSYAAQRGVKQRTDADRGAGHVVQSDRVTQVVHGANYASRLVLCMVSANLPFDLDCCTIRSLTRWLPRQCDVAAARELGVVLSRSCSHSRGQWYSVLCSLLLEVSAMGGASTSRSRFELHVKVELKYRPPARPPVSPQGGDTAVLHHRSSC